MASRYSTFLPVSLMRQHLFYDPLTGYITRRRANGLLSRKQKPVSPKTRYKTVTLFGNTYMEHRVAWALTTGEWPSKDIDHINGDTQDNRLENLREVDHQENLQNQRRAQVSNKSSGLLGVAARSNGRWDARIGINGKNLHLGCYDTPEEAHQAYLAAKRARHAGCTI